MAAPSELAVMRFGKSTPFLLHMFRCSQYPPSPTTEKLRREIDRVIKIYYIVQLSFPNQQGLIVEIRME